MKLFVGLLTLLLALVISVVAGYFSVTGLGHLFAAAFWPVVIMGASLEAGKLVAASWLKSNWTNANVGWLHKLYLTIAVIVLMVISALGIYGYLAKGHLEQEAPLATVELQIGEIERKVAQTRSDRDRLEERLKGLDQSVAVLLANAKNAREAQAANRARDAQKKDREAIQKQIAAADAEINTLSASVVPLRLKVSDVSAKLGPVKYVAQLFGWQDPNSAVQLVIVLIMFVFDPLAVMLVLSGTLTIGEWSRERQARKNPKPAPEAPMMEDFIFPRAHEGRGTLVTELPKGEITFNPDVDFFKSRLKEMMEDRDDQQNRTVEMEEQVKQTLLTQEQYQRELQEARESLIRMSATQLSLAEEVQRRDQFIEELLAKAEEPEVAAPQDESKLTDHAETSDTTKQGKIDFASFSETMFPKTNK